MSFIDQSSASVDGCAEAFFDHQKNIDALMSHIFVIAENNQVVPLIGTAYGSESMLQELLAKHPMLLAGEQFDAERPRRWLLVRRELGIPDEVDQGDRWTVDHLFLDQDGIPTFVEVKRSTDTRIRREVVGQMLDYAANATAYWPVDRLQAEFASSQSADDKDPDATLAEFLQGETDTLRFWEQVKLNLKAGKIRLLFVSDEIPAELRTVIEFLNQQMDPAEVLGLEIKLFSSADIKSLVPRVIGRTAEAIQKKASGGATKIWNEQSFFAVLAQRQMDDEASIAHHLLKWAKSRDLRIWWGRGATEASFYPVLDFRGKTQYIVAVRSGSRSTYIQLQFASMKEPFDTPQARSELLVKLRDKLGLAFTEDAKYPSFPLAELASTERLENFERILDWVIERTKNVG